MDIDIIDYRVEKLPDVKDGIKLFTIHRVNNEEYELNLYEESKGTQKLFAILPRLIIRHLTRAYHRLPAIQPCTCKQVVYVIKVLNYHSVIITLGITISVGVLTLHSVPIKMKYSN